MSSLFNRQNYIDSTVDEIARKCEFFQLKYDGIWGLVVVEQEEVKIYSRTLNIKHTFPRDPWLMPNSVFVGEYMFGSQWAQESSRKGKVFLFDCLMLNSVDISKMTYLQRYKLLRQNINGEDKIFSFVQSYPISALKDTWAHLEKTNEYEGVVGRNWNDSYSDSLLRAKLAVEDEYFITGFTEGLGRLKGTLGSIEVSQFVNGVSSPVMQVGGGFSDGQRALIWSDRSKYLFSVVKIRGKKRFASGALRHPNFVAFCEDKQPNQCILNKVEE